MMFRNQSSFGGTSDLFPQHKEYLKARAVSLDLARACGLRSVTKHEGAPLVGWQSLPSDALAIPYTYLPGEKNDHWRLRLDKPILRPEKGETCRYAVAGGEGVRPYIPTTIPDSVLQDVSVSLAIVESPIKSLSLLSADIPALGLGGCNAGGHDREAKEKGELRLHPELLSRINWEGRKVFLLLDSNRRNKSGVLRGEKLLARCLEAAGAVVFVAQLLPQDDGADWGPDDFIAAKGAQALRGVLEAARPATEIHHPFEEIRRRLARGKASKDGAGAPLGTLDNGELILSLDPRWEGVIRFDELSGRVVFGSSPPWDEEHAPKYPPKPGDPWTDPDDTRLVSWFSRHWGVRLSTNQAASLVQVMALKNPYHPVREYLSGLKWDGTFRLDGLFTGYFGAEDTAYTRAASSKTLLSAVARVFQPGCQAKYSAILEGPQDLGKSEAIRALVGDDWFTDSLPDLKDKEAAIQLAGKWVVELAELSSLGRAEVEQIKAFLSRRTDRYRPVFGRRAADHPRQCVFIGTTNDSAYLKDATGNVRFWPIRCTRADRESLARDRDQLWAEAFARYQAGEAWWFDDAELQALARAEQAERYEGDPWEDEVATYCEGRAYVQIADILRDLGLKKHEWSQAEARRVVRCLKAVGWRQGKPRKVGGKTVRVYESETGEAGYGYGYGYGSSMNRIPNCNPNRNPGNPSSNTVNNTSVDGSYGSYGNLEKEEEEKLDFRFGSDETNRNYRNRNPTVTGHDGLASPEGKEGKPSNGAATAHEDDPFHF